MRPLLALVLACVLSAAAGTDINLADNTGMTALHHALALGRTETVRQLVVRGALITKDSKKYSTWDWAVFGGDIDSFRLLLDKASGQLDRPTSLDVMRQAVAFGRDAFVAELEQRGTRLQRGRELDEALMTTVRSEQPRLAARFLELGANPDTRPFGNEYPLSRAATNGRADLVDLLLKHGARVDAVGSDQDGFSPRSTALSVAAMSDQREAAIKLLQAGADPRAQDNQAALFADLIGDDDILQALIRAGAPPPKPFEFAAWLPDAKPADEKTGDSTAAAYWGRQLAALGVFKSDNPSPDALAGRKLAIIALDDGMKDAEALLTARLSAETGAVLLEREEMRRIARERNLQDMLATPGRETAAGRLLGADVLVILRTHRLGKDTLREGKVAAVHTGLVVGTALSLEKSSLGEWADEAVAICRSAGPLTGEKPENLRLISVPRVVASLNTPTGRELERKLTITLAARLGRLPGVVVVERADLDRLALEKDPSLSNYATSAWLMDASLELPASESERGIALRIALRNPASGADQKLDVNGTLDGVGEMVDQTMSGIETIVATTPAPPWKRSAEAAAYLQKARQYGKAFLWAEAADAIEAARALGLDNDETTRLRMEAAVQRILHSSQLLIPQKRKRLGYRGPAMIVAYRAPLLMPVEDPRELDLPGYLDNANLALDIFATSLDRPEAKIAGVPLDIWLCGEFWDAATMPLRLTEAISYQKAYGEELDALRSRLKKLNTRAAAIALQRGRVMAYQTLLCIRLRQLAFWMPDEKAFQTEIARILRQARDWQPPLSEQSVWTSLYEVARRETRMINGRAGQAWIRAAAAMARSDNPAELYFATCLLGMETHSPAVYWNTVDALQKQFDQVNRTDRGLTTEIYQIGVALTDRPHVSIGCRNWYEEAFRGLLGHAQWRLDYLGMWGEDTWSITGQNGRYSPEFRSFMLAQAVTRAQTLQTGAPGGLTNLRWDESDGFTSDQLDRVGREFAAALPRIQAFAGPYTSYALDRAQLLASLKGSDATVSASQPKIIASPPRNPFLKALPVPSAQHAGLGFNMLDRNLNAAKTGWNLVHRTTYEKDTGARTSVRYFHRFDAAGNPVDFHQVPDLVTNGEELAASDRWLLVAGYRPNAAGDSNDDVWLIADKRRDPWTWRIIKAASTRGYLTGGLLIGDHFVYPFIHNPTGPRSGGPDEYETKGDPTFGVMDIDLVTSKETLIASSRRQPPVTPLESEQIAPYKSVRQVSPTGIVIAGKSRTSAQVYDTVSGSWTPYDAAFKTAWKNSSPSSTPPGFVNVDGVDWNITYGIRKGLLPVFVTKGQRFDIPVELPEADLSTYSSYDYAMRLHGRNKERPNLAVSWQPDGGVVSTGGGFYYWIPMEQVRDAIRAQLSAK